MKIGIHVYLWKQRNYSLFEIVKKAKGIGFDSIEIPAQKLLNEYIPILRKTLRDYDIKCVIGVGLDYTNDISSCDEKIRLNGTNYLKKCIEIAHYLECNLITGTTHSALGVLPSEGRTKEKWLNSVNSLRVVARFAKNYNVCIGVEAVNRFRNYLINTLEEALEYVNAVGEENVIVHCDTFHMNIEEKDFYNPIKLVGKKLGYVHANESNRGFLGEGHVNWREFFKALYEIGYDNWLTIETFPPYVKGLSEYVGAWRELYSNEDELAVQGLRFLKEKCKKFSL